MSRIPQPSSSRPGLKPPTTPGKSRIPVPKSPMRVAGGSTPSRPVATPASRPKAAPAPKPAVVPEETDNATPAMGIKEAIALKRAEAKKAMMKSGGSGGGGGGGGFDTLESLEDALPTDIGKKQEEEDLLGRLPVRDAIEQARSTGSLNLAARSLPCLPSALFEIHLGLTSDPLKSVPNEPTLPPSEAKPRRGGDKPAWFEAQDLTVLKAWKNDIEEVQHEISLFGSLKTVDLHENKLTGLPHTFTDLTSLTVLDLSHNALTSLPEKLFALPELTNLNVSHNLLTSLPFNAPFTAGNSGRAKPKQSSGGFFTPAVTHSTTPLPRLLTFNASYNTITATTIDSEIPVALTQIDLSGNPLGLSQQLLRNLARLKRIKEIKMHKCEIDDDSLPDGLSFALLRLLDLSETQVTKDAAERALKGANRELNFDFSAQEPPDGVLRVLVGKQVIKEQWELELERRTNLRKAAATAPIIDDWFEETPTKKPATERAAAIPTSTTTAPTKAPPKAKEVVKEAWEIEAEQGLLTAGGRRRARAAAAIDEEDGSARADSPASPSASGLSNPQYFAHATQTLTLPASQPPAAKAGHGRAFSMAATSTSTSDLAVPTPTLPLSVLAVQPFAQTLRVLSLVNRRADRSFALPSSSSTLPGGVLPMLEELNLEGCNLDDAVSVHAAAGGTATPARTSEPLLPTLARLFPSLRTLNLSYNALTSAALTAKALNELIVPSENGNASRPGLRHLRLRGNRISDLDGFLGITSLAPGLKLEELDLRDNEIGKLPPELGLLQLDVLLVEGNVFRVPQRRVWEREGTKGLLTWLRGRIEE